MKKKDDAQARLERSQPLFGKTTFLEAYPQVTGLTLEVRAMPMGFGDSPVYHYSLVHPPGQYCPCPNRQCSGGGFDMGSFLHGLISRRETSGEGGGHCVGNERMNRRDTRSCFYSFSAKASITYAPEENEKS